MKTRFYYNAAELLALTEIMYYDLHSVDISSEGIIGFQTFCNALSSSTQTLVQDDAKYSKEVFSKFVWPIIWDMPIAYLDVEHDPYEEVEKPVPWYSYDVSLLFVPIKQKLFGRIVKWYNESVEKYLLPLQLYSANESGLMDDVVSSTISKFNDTPQNSDNNFASDNHVSNITSTTTSNAVATKIARIEEIRALKRNLESE